MTAEYHSAIESIIIGHARLGQWDEIRKLLVDHNLWERIDTFRSPTTGNTLLHIALSCGASIGVVRQILQVIDVNTPNDAGLTPLSSLILNKRYYEKAQLRAMLVLLLENGADVNYICTVEGQGCGWTPYLHAMMIADSDALKLLREYGGTLSVIKAQ